MYYTINKTGLSERGGLVQVRFDLYLEPSDQGYSDHRVEVPIIPPEGYSGQRDSEGNIVDAEGYKSWIDSLPKEKRNNPFCCHFCQFDPDVTDEEILYVGELALAMQYQNLSVHKNLHRPINQPVKFSENTEKKEKSKSRMNEILSTDFTKLTVKSKIPYKVRA